MANFDYDTDGRDFLYHNNRDGAFTRITTCPEVNTTGESCAATWVDFDNDGHLDLLVCAWARPTTLYRNNGNGTFTLANLLGRQVQNSATGGLG